MGFGGGAVATSPSSTTSPFSYPASPSSTLARMYQESLLTDCCLVGEEGEVVGAHRAVLATTSPLLASLLESRHTDLPLLALPSTPTATIRALLDLLYLGTLARGEEQGVEEVARALHIDLGQVARQGQEGVVETVARPLVQGEQMKAEVKDLSIEKLEMMLPKGIELKEEKVEKEPLIKLPKGIIYRVESTGGGGEHSIRDKQTKEDDKLPQQSLASQNKISMKNRHKLISKTHSCSVCDFKTKKLRLFKHHRKIHEELISVDCKQCGQAVPKTNLNNHMVYKHGERTIQCEVCAKKYFTNAHLREHINRAHSEKKYQCSECAFPPFSYHRNLEMHMSRHHREKTILCTKCPFGTNENHMLVLHEQKKHTTRDEWPMCDQCDYRNWNKHKIKVHYDKVHNGVRVKCDLCSSTFTQRSNMVAHMKKVHSDQLVGTGEQNEHLAFSKRYIIAPNGSEEAPKSD